MTERYIYDAMGYNKTVVNPINRNEIFTCSDLMKDYKKCLRRFNLGSAISLPDCIEIKSLSRKCYSNTEKDFEALLIDKFEEKKKYIKYLKENNSLLYSYYISDPNTFSLSLVHEQVSNDFAETINIGIIENNKDDNIK